MPYAEPLTDEELATALSRLPGWSHEGTLIRRSVRLAGFREAIALVDAVADAAEAAGHHPDIAITGYRMVTFTLTTHAADALTRRDIDLAGAIDRLVAQHGAR